MSSSQSPKPIRGTIMLSLDILGGCRKYKSQLCAAAPDQKVVVRVMRLKKGAVSCGVQP